MSDPRDRDDWQGADDGGGAGERMAIWPRLGWVIVYAIIFQVVEVVLGIVVLLQLGALIFTRGPNAELRGFAGTLRDYVAELIDYVTLRSERRPWPFARETARG